MKWTDKELNWLKNHKEAIDSNDKEMIEKALAGSSNYSTSGGDFLEDRSIRRIYILSGYLLGWPIFIEVDKNRFGRILFSLTFGKRPAFDRITGYCPDLVSLRNELEVSLGFPPEIAIDMIDKAQEVQYVE